MSAAELKELLSNPLSLFILMMFGSFLSMFKQLKDARNNGATISVLEYLISIDTVLGLGANILAFIGLIMTDTLNWTGALAIGYVSNSVVDLKIGGRSAAIVDSIPNKTDKE